MFIEISYMHCLLPILSGKTRPGSFFISKRAANNSPQISGFTNLSRPRIESYRLMPVRTRWGGRPLTASLKAASVGEFGIIGVDLAPHVFQLHGANATGAVDLGRVGPGNGAIHYPGPFCFRQRARLSTIGDTTA